MQEKIRMKQACNLVEVRNKIYFEIHDLVVPLKLILETFLSIPWHPSNLSVKRFCLEGFHGVRWMFTFHVNMYIRWKLLFGFGFIFWVFLCLHDTFYVDPVTKGYYSEPSKLTKGFPILSTIRNARLVGHSWTTDVKKADQSTGQRKERPSRVMEFREGGFSFLLNLVFWNAIAFLTSLATCLLFKSLVTITLKYRNKQRYQIK